MLLASVSRMHAPLKTMTTLLPEGEVRREPGTETISSAAIAQDLLGHIADSALLRAV